jgi:hypothetical protein
MTMTPEEYELWRYNTCTRKSAYNRLDKAERAAHKRRKETGLAIHAYACPFSLNGKPHYHIGRKKRSQRQKAIGSAGNDSDIGVTYAQAEDA